MIINQQPPTSGGGGGGGTTHTVQCESSFFTPAIFDYDSGEWSDIPYTWDEQGFEVAVGDRVLIRQRHYGDSMYVETESGESVQSYFVDKGLKNQDMYNWYRAFTMPDANVIVYA